jgi:DNA invertase Pin-like site-specific DNA recombinase
MKYGYARVSTRGQATNGNSLEDQRKQLQDAGCEKIIEEQYTGTTTDRPAFDSLINQLQAGDTLVVTKLDRFARSAAAGSQLITQLTKQEIRVHILNMGEINDSPQGRLMMQILLAFAEFERDMIVERTQAGKAIARTKAGFREGRPPISTAKKDLGVRLILKEHMSYKKASAATGLSISTLTRAVRAAKFRQDKGD